MKKRVIRGKIIRENWMNENGLSDVMNLIKRQKWERLFWRRELMHVAVCKEFYANLTVSLSKKKEVATSMVRGVKIELDNMILASILGVPGNTGICEYIKDVWEESKFCKPLEITRKFANDEMITTLKFMIFHMVTGDWLTMVFEAFNVPLIDKHGEEPKRRRDDEEEKVNNEASAANMENEEVNEEEDVQHDFDWEVVNEEAGIQGESGSAEKFYDAEYESQGSADMVEDVSEVSAPVPEQQKETTTIGVDPSGPVGSISDSVFVPLQAEFERARVDKIQDELDRAQVENARLLALLQQAKSQHKP
ncbi:hypothetical protein Dimus_013769 [Dionaea muscipula]